MKRHNKKNNKSRVYLKVILAVLLVLLGITFYNEQESRNLNNKSDATSTANIEESYIESNKEDSNNESKNSNINKKSSDFDLDSIEEYSGNPSISVNGNIPFFSQEDIVTKEFEKYSKLDSLGRCGVAFANISKSTLPTEDRGEIGAIKPSGWTYKSKSNNNKYPDLINGNYVYNRCHLIAYCLAGENANELNLITGTRYLNVEGMLPLEEKVADYMKDNPSNHVLYRVTPCFKDDNLIASGVLIEAYSVEDKGKGICFCKYCYNVQPGIKINYKNGLNSRDNS